VLIRRQSFFDRNLIAGQQHLLLLPLLLQDLYFLDHVPQVRQGSTIGGQLVDQQVAALLLGVMRAVLLVLAVMLRVL